MSNPDPNKIIFSSRYKYFLNKGVEVGSTSISAQSIPAGETDTYNLSIPIDDTDDYTQVKINFSHDPNDWYVFPLFDVNLDANFNIAVVGSYSGSALNLTFFVINQTGSAHTNTATDVSVRIYAFEPPN